MSKAIMVQGTMSNAGKSILTAALCRIFKQDGLNVAPFKSQNMALNSFITSDGLEMGRAQVVQAEAAGAQPDVRMNPILLKPTEDCSSQVIVNGKVYANISASNYYQIKDSLRPFVQAAYDALASDYDVIVLEGAGSPAELNLAYGDFVNMGMAQMAKAPVLLVGDIDRGGIFPQLYGTVALLPKDQSRLIKATIVNKFRGDLTLFSDGVKILEEICKVPCAGVIPYLEVDIEDEDSVSERLRRFSRPGSKTLLDIAVIGLPHISNFTDFSTLQATPGVGLRYVNNCSDLGKPDLLIIPGSKSTISDFLGLRESGLEAAILKLAAIGTTIIGICGGYQMLGQSISDPHGSEGIAGRSISGMGLLPVSTTFASGEDKRRSRVSAKALNVRGSLSAFSGKSITGYEIHMGNTQVAANDALLELADRRLDGCQSGNIYGSYLHGFFDSSACREAVLGALAAAKGLSLAAPAFNYDAYKEQQYDLLAAGVRQALNMPLIYRILEQGV